MLEKPSAVIGGTVRPQVASTAFVVPVALQSSGLWQQQQQQQQQQQRLKSRRRRPNSSNGIGSIDAWHAAPLPRLRSTPHSSSPGSHDRESIQRTRPDVHRPAAQVGAGASSGGSTSRNRGSLSSAAPQTIADPAIRVLWQAEEVQAHGRGGRSNSGRIAAAASLEVESSSGRGGALGDSGGGGVGEGVVVGREGKSDVPASAAESAVPCVGDIETGHQEEREQQSELAGEDGGEEGGEQQDGEGLEEVELGPGIDDYSRQLIGRLTKLARSGLWKASFKVLRVEQALNARKLATARENGEEYSTSWPVVEQKVYNTILAALSRAGKWEEAALLLKEMETREIRRDAVSYACLIAACGRGMQWKKALSSLVEMRDLGIKANSFVYSAAIDSCAKGRQWQKALLLLREMEVVDCLPPNLICYNAAADACGKAGRPGEALALLAKMRKVGIKPNEVSYLSVISACSRVGDWHQALGVLDEMSVFGLQHNLKCYCSAITACGKGGKWQQALELLDVMHTEGPPPNDYCYNAAISACGKSGQWQRSKELLVVMRERGVPPDLISYNTAIDACGKGGRWKEGLKLFVDMVKASEDPWDPETGDPKPPTPDATTYGAVITACSRSKQWQIALRFLDDMEKKGVERTEGVFHATLAGCARMGRWRECIVTLDQMRKSGVQPRVTAYNSVITACGRGGEWQRAIAILQQMSSRGATPDVITLNAAMAACAQSKRWKEAKTILDYMRDPTGVPTTEFGGLTFPILNINGSSVSRPDRTGKGTTDGADGIFTPVVAPGAEGRGGDAAANGGIGVDAPVAAASSGGGGGRGEERGKATWQQRRRRGDGLWPPRPDAFSFHTVIKALAAAGMWQDAVDLLEEMADERRRFLQSVEASLETAVGGAGAGGGGRQWPINVDRFRLIFKLELKNNEIVGHEREHGWSEFALSPEVSLRAKAMDVLIVIERDEKVARLKRQALYETIAGR